MKKNKLHLLTFLVIAIVSTLGTLGASRYFYMHAKETLLKQKMQAGQREIRELGILLEQQLQAGLPIAIVINNLQKSILNTDTQTEFVCMYNTEGVELCHPNPSLVGRKIDINNSNILKDGKQENFQKLLERGKTISGIRHFPESNDHSSEIVNVYPVKGTDWMLASHSNINALQAQLENLYQKFLTGSLLLVIILTGNCFWFIKIIYKKYENQIDLKVENLNKEIHCLGVINKQLDTKRKAIIDNISTKNQDLKKRLLAYHKDKIITIDIEDVVYIVLAETVSVLTLQNNTYTINSSLDELMRQLNNEIFYRANRQYIVNINAIESISIYGRNQLRIETKLKPEEAIIISKNKVSDFKKWLDQ
ncbi:LytR/AlgR family response regulator transcription factor [Elizabethkingia miricola]|uniref:LytR/AlgR family response regulator transcription factor n=2 Tax=Elizabethkingia miricola TaxID=172045 RepID=UPI000C146B20|nr:LytTR family DNA-binding domain-containing protein [Elizabethkingia miricola]PSL86870.1 LytTR family transcriptional regulator [Elizabethkingia miricola]QHQ85834.1 LytTR family transcriptional regulator [Elizabethkingia miricola]UIO97070.1 LytTR family transcriptional regulator [Elizabethkingia miricola]WER13855.1 LytTR family DNA-binding domain-containing protein [Elizabethkingia miricola]WGL74032.1 LytTR family DNA-binding domain-containing protein [Elizabethkingia miricola]